MVGDPEFLSTFPGNDQNHCHQSSDCYGLGIPSMPCQWIIMSHSLCVAGIIEEKLYNLYKVIGKAAEMGFGSWSFWFHFCQMAGYLGGFCLNTSVGLDLSEAFLHFSSFSSFDWDRTTLLCSGNIPEMSLNAFATLGNFQDCPVQLQIEGGQRKVAMATTASKDRCNLTSINGLSTHNYNLVWEVKVAKKLY